ncbi:hypothetical protein G7039_35615 (plasmid) [Rhizobium leguminosarum]|nr:hypothetical protein G7039_35615 [Rhizobium leguminosarum]
MFDVPRRVYARLIEHHELEYALFDAIDADWFDKRAAAGPTSLRFESWAADSISAPIYVVEFNARGVNGFASFLWLATRFGMRRRLSQWFELSLLPENNGPAAVYFSMTGEPRYADAFLGRPDRLTRLLLEQLTDLSSQIDTRNSILDELNKIDHEEVFALDVGQGSANALVPKSGHASAYVDLGRSVLGDSPSWQTGTTFCLSQAKTVILSHWHYDHFYGANMQPHALTLTWIAPYQKIGAGPQLSMASSIASNGQLKIWGGNGTISSTSVDLERSVGKGTDLNRSGLAVWVKDPNGTRDPILLPGDAGYKDLRSLLGRNITSFAAAHHGGKSPGIPPRKSGATSAKVVLSYGLNNGYGHPLPNYIGRLGKQGWALGQPGAPIDERRTEDRKTVPTHQIALGNVRLNWGHGRSPPQCSCGCTIEPTQ